MCIVAKADNAYGSSAKAGPAIIRKRRNPDVPRKPDAPEIGVVIGGGPGNWVEVRRSPKNVRANEYVDGALVVHAMGRGEHGARRNHGARAHQRSIGCDERNDRRIAGISPATNDRLFV